MRTNVAALLISFSIGFFNFSFAGEYFFEKNNGQITNQSGQVNKEVEFLGRFNQFNIQLKEAGFSYDFYKEIREWDLNDDGIDENKLKSINFHRVDFNYLNANQNIEWIYESSLSKFSHTIGAELVHYQQTNRVLAKNVWNNIDIEFLLSTEFKYNIIVRPGGNINDVQFSVNGADIKELNKTVLEIKTSIGTIEETIPVSFYEKNNQKVDVDFELENNVISFKAAQLDKSQTLIIDPLPNIRRKWGTYYGGFQGSETSDYVRHSTIDPEGNVYVIGDSEQGNGIATAGAYISTYTASGYEGHLTKWNVEGDLLWGTFLGGGGETRAGAIAWHNNELYISGQVTNGFATSGTAGLQNSYGGGSFDGILFKFDEDGGFIYSTFIGGNGSDQGKGLAVDASGIYMSLNCASNNLSTDGTNPGGTDVAITRLNLDGTLDWLTLFGGSSLERSGALGIDNAGNIFISGTTESNNLTTSAGASQPTHGGGEDWFIAKYSPAGTYLEASYFGGQYSDFNAAHRRMRFVNGTDPVITGSVRSANLASAGAYIPTLADGWYRHLAVARFSNDLTTRWSTYIGDQSGNSSSSNYAIDANVDADNNIWVSGYTTTSSGIGTADGYQPTKGDWADGFLISLSADLTQHLYGTYIGSTALDGTNNGGGFEFASSINFPKNMGISVAGYHSSISTTADGGALMGPNQVSTAGSVNPTVFSPGGSQQDNFLMFFCGLENVQISPTDDIINICSSEEVNLSTAAIDGYVEFNWTTDPFTDTINNALTYTTNTEGYTFLEGVDEIGCKTYDSVLVNVTQIAEAELVSSNGEVFCSGDPVNTNLSLTNPFVTYEWSDGSTGNTLDVSTPGLYSVIVGENGCIDTVEIDISTAEFELSVNGDTQFCSGDIGITELVVIGGSTFDWSTGENTAMISVSPAATTNYEVIVSDGNCTETLTQEIVVGNAVEFDLGDDINATVGEQVTINGPAGYATYSWDDNDVYSCTDCITTNVTVNGEIVTTLTVTDTDGCETSDFLTIRVLNFTVPTGFSPNGDNVNDWFVIPGIETIQNSFTVWNRWGGIVYTAENYDNSWDGTCQGSGCLGAGNLPEGTYFYKLSMGAQVSQGYISIKF